MKVHPALKPAVLGSEYLRRSMVHPKPTVARWLRHKLVDYGPVYVKVGQFVGSRKDFFPEYITKELKNLQDNVSPILFEDIVQYVDTSRFATFESDPLSVASIAQVHRATLAPTGAQVVVKIKKPDVDSQVTEDIQSLKMTLSLISMCMPSNRSLSDMYDIICQCETTFVNELDYRKEAENLLEMRRYMSEHDVVVPRVVRGLSSTDVLVMEYIRSDRVSRNLENGEEFARAVSRAVAIVAIKHGVIHGDLHQGNMGVMADKRVALYDFGTVLRLDKKVIRDLFSALVVKDVEGIKKILIETGYVEIDPTFVDMGEAKLETLLAYIVEYTDHLDIRKLIARISSDAFLADGAPHFRTNAELFLLSRTVALLEGSCKEVYPGYSYNQVILDVLSQSDVMYLINHRSLFQRGVSDIGGVFGMPRPTPDPKTRPVPRRVDHGDWVYKTLLLALMYWNIIR